MAKVQQMALWGQDHEDWGEIVTRTIGRSCAIALSRGRWPKGYKHLDPNEDAVAARSDGTNWMLAVADGHYGFDAARSALSAVLNRTESMNWADPKKEIRSVFRDAVAAVTEGMVDATGERSNSRTALTVSLVRDQVVFAGTMGDTYALAVGSKEARLLGRSSDFLGPNSNPDDMPVRSVHLVTGGTLVLCTDGLSRFLGRKWTKRLAEMTRNQPNAVNLVTDAIQAAFAGGAGDNIAVAVLRL